MLVEKLFLCGLNLFIVLAWNHLKQDSWGDKYPKCNGNSQSPINIDIKINTTKMKPIEYINYDNNIPGKNLPITNDGHSIYISFTNIKQSEQPSIKGGILRNEIYILDNVHFHWGAKKVYGSEHTFNGKEYALEGHFVHRNSRYSNVSEAAGYSDGLTVIGIVYHQAFLYPTSPLHPVTNHLPEVIATKQNSTLSGTINLRKTFPGIGSKEYYNYAGSLTTPNCQESVNWIVYAAPSKVAWREVFD